jgi:hypothetical protein
MIPAASYFGIASATIRRIPDNRLTWLDFFINPEQLKDHIAALKAGQNVKPTVRDLLGALLDQIVSSHPDAGLGCRYDLNLSSVLLAPFHEIS